VRRRRVQLRQGQCPSPTHHICLGTDRIDEGGHLRVCVRSIDSLPCRESLYCCVLSAASLGTEYKHIGHGSASCKASCLSRQSAEASAREELKSDSSARPRLGNSAILLGCDGRKRHNLRCCSGGEKADPVLALNRDGKILRSWGKGMYKNPHSIRIRPAGNIWTVDSSSSMV